MADAPDFIDLDRHLHLRGISFDRRPRRLVLLLILAVVVLGLFNVFGQRPEHIYANAPQAQLELYAPSHLRGGLLYEARFTITAHKDIGNAVLVFSPGWNEGQQMNTLEPVPLGQGSHNGDMILTFGHIPAGQKYRFFMQFQVDATNVGRRRADVSLFDRGTKLLTIHRTLTFYP